MQRFCALASILVLAGCANPILTINAPGYLPAKSNAPDSEPGSMTQSLEKLNHVRAAYYEAIRYQSQQSQDATTGLVWLGTALAGAAYGGVHRDVLFYPAITGGTTYGLARTQLDARRLQIWTEGIKALDCAKSASLPLNVSSDFRHALKQGLNLLQTDQSKLLNEASKMSRVLSRERVTLPEDARKEYDALLQKVGNSNIELSRSVAAGHALLHASNGGELSVTVDKIHTKVVEASNNIAVDITAVKQLVAGLGGFASLLMPGSAIEADVSNLFKSRPTAVNWTLNSNVLPPSLTDTPTPELVAAKEDLIRALESAQASQIAVNSLVQSVDIVAITNALRTCDVSNVSFAMTVAPESLTFTFTKGTYKGVEITGGTSPYDVAMLDAVPEGLSWTFNTSDGRTFKVITTDKTPVGTYTLRVRDGGQRQQTKSLIVKVVPP